VRVFISCDIEGITGVVDSQLQTSETGRDYEKARRLMTMDVNAAVRGAFSGGAEYVLVSDGHGASHMRNIVLEELDSRAEALVGVPRSLGQMEGIAHDFDVAFFVGYHARMGAHGILSHTISGRVVRNVWVNDILVGECGINALIAGAYAVPVALVTGDQHVTAEAKQILPWVDSVCVKHAVTRECARCKPPEVTSKLIEQAARECVEKTRAGSHYHCFELEPPMCYSLEFMTSGQADAASRMHGIERISATVFRFSAKDAVEGFRLLRSLIALAQ